MKFIPYLMFEGNAEEVLNYYAKVFDGNVTSIMRYSDNPDTPAPDHYKDKILHAELNIGDEFLYLSDSFPDQHVGQGEQISIHIAFDTSEELVRVYEALKIGAEISMELQDTFWNAKFASLVDKFGIAWSLNYQYPEKE